MIKEKHTISNYFKKTFSNSEERIDCGLIDIKDTNFKFNFEIYSIIESVITFPQDYEQDKLIRKTNKI